MNTYSISALKGFYKDCFPRDISAPGLKEVAQGLSIEEVEALMLARATERESKVNNEYNELFYGVSEVK